MVVVDMVKSNFFFDKHFLSAGGARGWPSSPCAQVSRGSGVLGSQARSICYNARSKPFGTDRLFRILERGLRVAVSSCGLGML